MKKIFSAVLLIALIFAACQQEQLPAPVAPPVQTLSTEDTLYGDWILRKSEVYYYDTLVNAQTQTYNSPTTCHIYFDSTVCATNANYLNCLMGHTQCTVINSTWRVTPERLEVGGAEYDILMLGTDTLVFQEYIITNQTSKKRYYFNR